MKNTDLGRMPLLTALLFCIGSLFCISSLIAQTGPAKLQILQRIKVVKTPVKGEENINAQLAAMDSRMQAVQAEIQRAQTDFENLRAIQNSLKSQLDNMNEISEMSSMRLQMAMDRRSKFMETLSNLLKKIDDTESAIVQNMK
jgi:Skp family chaperone for outer membrane proteins